MYGRTGQLQELESAIRGEAVVPWAVGHDVLAVGGLSDVERVAWEKARGAGYLRHPGRRRPALDVAWRAWCGLQGRPAVEVWGGRRWASIAVRGAPAGAFETLAKVSCGTVSGGLGSVFADRLRWSDARQIARQWVRVEEVEDVGECLG